MAIERAVSDGVAPRAAARLGLASDALVRLGRELDDIARTSQVGGAPPRLGPVPLGPLLAAVAAEWQPYAEAVGVRLHVRGSDLWAESEAAMLSTILRNLVGNAVKYAGRGGRVVIGCRRRGGRIAIEVHDDGPGIPPSASPESSKPSIGPGAATEPGSASVFTSCARPPRQSAIRSACNPVAAEDRSSA